MRRLQRNKECDQPCQQQTDDQDARAAFEETLQVRPVVAFGHQLAQAGLHDKGGAHEPDNQPIDQQLGCFQHRPRFLYLVFLCLGPPAPVGDQHNHRHHAPDQRAHPGLLHRVDAGEHG